LCKPYTGNPAGRTDEIIRVCLPSFAAFAVKTNKASPEKCSFSADCHLQSLRRYGTIIWLERHLYLSGGQKKNGNRY
jgi:hypothetical protein